ncbi:WD40/YVTN/BNR-like repeat-containing protein [Saccharothrix obliqua]|uniref:WD40/YVTN/BNR-like repeat-containing protein n=1 Tax=Saccharothrix obliqua TaxID=2861747 RepID=UPI001C5E2E75|nr:exo-alpha-sialidase [Saccharothrix obliqua]MBW4720696.1 exo-alpha-sialidase [Saccharothrix obliqua]
MHVLAIGTRKGLWLATSADRRSWDLDGPHHPMTEVSAIALDHRRLLVGTANSHFGPSLLASEDLGRTWEERSPIDFPADAALERVWQLTTTADPDVVYAGVQPSALFRSDDGGRKFSLVEGLWEHPHRPEWGAGYGGQAVHTVLPHPRDERRVTVAMSTGGVYRTFDGGTSWEPANRGVQAYFLPDPYPEFGQCVHKIARHPAEPDRMYLQNHHGVYRSTDGGDTWHSIADGLPSDFGFAVVVHPHRPEVVYNFPLTADSDRFPPGGACAVHRSTDGGDTWTALRTGLPDDFWTSVLRDAMCVDAAEPAGVYFGSRSGEVYASADEGDTWRCVARHLPDVLCVRAAEV